jgi:hypothetical protein
MGDVAPNRRIADVANELAFVSPPAADRFTTEEKAAALTREVRFRRKVYARRVALGQMHMNDAIRQIEIFLAIEADYRGRLEQGSLAL